MHSCESQAEVARKSQELLDGKLRRVKKAALAAALVPLAAAGTAVPSQAVMVAKVKTSVTKSDAGYAYEYTIMNLSDPGDPEQSDSSSGPPASAMGEGQPWLIEWSVPVFDAKDVTNVKTPEGWGYEVVKTTATSQAYNNPGAPFGKLGWVWSPTADPVMKSTKPEDAHAYGANPAVFQKPPFVLHFFSKTTVNDDGVTVPVKPITPMDMLTGFGFTSPYNATTAPYVTYLRIQGKNTALMGKAVSPKSPALEKAVSVKVSSASQPSH